MVHLFRKMLFVLLGLLAAGGIIWPLQRAFAGDLRARHLMPPPLSLEVYSELRQSSFAGLLGGLRSVVASLLHLQAHRHFENQEWYSLRKDYKTITALDPHNLYYWSTGAWHLAYNAASHARNDESLREVERRLLEREYLEQGDDFLEEGTRVNPLDGQLWAERGRLWANPFKRPDYRRAARNYEEAVKRGITGVVQRSHLYALSRAEGESEAAWKLARGLRREHPEFLDFPTFRVLYWVLGQQDAVPSGERPTLKEVFSSPRQALLEMLQYAQRLERENYPRFGLRRELGALRQELGLPLSADPFAPLEAGELRALRGAGRERIPGWRGGMEALHGRDHGGAGAHHGHDHASEGEEEGEK